MKRWGLIAAVLAIAVLVPVRPSTAAPILYEEVSLGFQQLGAVGVTPSPNPGYNLWTTIFRVTNTTSDAIADVILWYLGVRLNTGGGLVNAQWNDPLQLFATPDATLQAVNNTGYLLFGLSNLSPLPSFSVDATDSMPVWHLGSLAAGQFVDVTLVRELTNNVDGINTVAVEFTTTVVPEPGTVFLLGGGLLGAALRNRIRRRRARR